jgi:hypothetical protein
MRCVFFEVGTECLHVIWTNFEFKWLVINFSMLLYLQPKLLHYINGANYSKWNIFKYSWFWLYVIETRYGE